jgi:hypothetical protein
MIDGLEVCDQGQRKSIIVNVEKETAADVSKLKQKLAGSISEQTMLRRMEAADAAPAFAGPIWDCEPGDKYGTWFLHRVARESDSLLPESVVVLAVHRTAEQVRLRSAGKTELDAEVINACGETPLHIAAFTGGHSGLGFVSALLEVGFRAHRARTDLVRQQVWCRGHVEGSFPAGSTPLHFVLNQGRYVVLDELLKAIAMAGSALPATATATTVQRGYYSASSLDELAVLLFNSSVYFSLKDGQVPFEHFKHKEECNFERCIDVSKRKALQTGVKKSQIAFQNAGPYRTWAAHFNAVDKA